MREGRKRDAVENGRKRKEIKAYYPGTIVPIHEKKRSANKKKRKSSLTKRRKEKTVQCNVAMETMRFLNIAKKERRGSLRKKKAAWGPAPAGKKKEEKK